MTDCWSYSFKNKNDESIRNPSNCWQPECVFFNDEHSESLKQLFQSNRLTQLTPAVVIAEKAL